MVKLLQRVASANAVVMGDFDYDAITSVFARPLEKSAEKAIYYHFLDENEKLWDVAKAFSVSPEEICKMNGFENESDILGVKGLVVIKF